MTEKTPTSPPAPGPTPPARRITDGAATSVTRIGPGTRIRGSLTGGDSVDLAGSLEGPSSVTGLYHVRETARVAGDVTAAGIVVEGEISGRSLVAEKVEIGAGARVRANVWARVVAIAEGAFFDGQVHMQGRDGQVGPVSFREKRKGRRRNEPPTPPE